jgi:hypothetical protein
MGHEVNIWWSVCPSVSQIFDVVRQNDVHEKRQEKKGNEMRSRRRAIKARTLLPVHTVYFYSPIFTPTTRRREASLLNTNLTQRNLT